MAAGRSGAAQHLLALLDVVDKVCEKCPWTKTKKPMEVLRYVESEIQELVTELDDNVNGEEKGEDGVQGECGDLIFVVLLLAKTCERCCPESSFSGMLEAVNAKIRRRCPHVFGDEQASTPEEAAAIWTRVKSMEKGRKKRKKVEETTASQKRTRDTTTFSRKRLKA